MNPFYKWENWGMEQVSNLPKVMYLVNGQARTWTQLLWILSFYTKLRTESDSLGFLSGPDPEKVL